MSYLIADFDDFFDLENRLDLLIRLKEHIPGYKVTLMTCPGRSTKEFCQGVSKIPWIQLGLHGDTHIKRECENWTKEQTLAYLDKYESWGCFQKVFRAPYWISSKGLREGLAERGYILCENKESDYTGKLYRLTSEVSVHGHISNTCGNGLEEKFDYYKSLNTNYKFISSYDKEIA